MILYHCNIGYPVLSPDSEIFIPALETKARNVHAQEGIDSWMKVQEADADYEEMCYYHKLKPDEKNHSSQLFTIRIWIWELLLRLISAHWIISCSGK